MKTDGQVLGLVRKYADMLLTPDEQAFMKTVEQYGEAGMPGLALHQIRQIYAAHSNMIEAGEVRLEPTPAAPVGEGAEIRVVILDDEMDLDDADVAGA